MTIQTIAFASSVYWPDMADAQQIAGQVSDNLKGISSATLISTEEELKALESLPNKGAAVFIPLSGGIQPLMMESAKRFSHIGLYNAYLEDSDEGRKLMQLNAHPSCTDFYSWARMGGRRISWLSSDNDVLAYTNAWNACEKLTSAKILKLGETEPWVINSERDPAQYKEKLGITVIPISSPRLYERIKEIAPDTVRETAAKWLNGAASSDINEATVQDACRVHAAVQDLINEHDASGASLACFTMATELGITGCLALSMLNADLNRIGACEGDLEAAISLMLLKYLGNDFVWVANPIIRSNEVVDLVHCTAPTGACGAELRYRLLCHHETGLGAATEVALPGSEDITMLRIGNKLSEMVWHTGTTERIEKLPSCHTQIRVHLNSKTDVVSTLMGTHLIQAFGDWSRELKLCAEFLNLGVAK